MIIASPSRSDCFSSSVRPKTTCAHASRGGARVRDTIHMPLSRAARIPGHPTTLSQHDVTKAFPPARTVDTLFSANPSAFSPSGMISRPSAASAMRESSPIVASIACTGRHNLPAGCRSRPDVCPRPCTLAASVPLSLRLSAAWPRFRPRWSVLSCPDWAWCCAFETFA